MKEVVGGPNLRGSDWLRSRVREETGRPNSCSDRSCGTFTLMTTCSESEEVLASETTDEVSRWWRDPSWESDVEVAVDTTDALLDDLMLLFADLCVPSEADDGDDGDEADSSSDSDAWLFLCLLGLASSI